MEQQKKDYKDTLLMPNTEFPMRGNLGVNEIGIESHWDEIDLYNKVLNKNLGKTPFYLHDGPPYANGPIHIGHAMNKILKDIIIRYKSMNGFYAPYLPGWDTHGLPIEHALSKSGKINRKEMSVAEFRKHCESYAYEQVDIQRKGFKRLGILGDWENPYITLDHKYEAEQIRCFAKMVERGLIFKGLKPVYWSPSSETALAEAEVEYQDVEATSIYVAFPVVDGKGLLEPSIDELVIWTTTPWTMPANLAICAGPLFEYSVIQANDRRFVVATDLIKDFTTTCGITEYQVLKTLRGDELEGVTYKHLLFDRVSPVILGDHVTLDSGTGLVHTAPGHGEDDFIVGKKYNLDILCPVDSKGYMTKEAGKYEGMFYEEANDVIIKDLEDTKMLLKATKFMHSYPHDWRTKKPIIFRATPQWFASIAKFKDEILESIKTVNWVPNWGEVRLSNMIKDRADWCISRQRVWGVPIPIFYCEDGTAILDENVINHVADLFSEYGSNIWFEKEPIDLLPEGYKNEHSPNGKFTKETDIMDVWFDSGTSHHGALKLRYNTPVADVYLEGCDQYRGWFNSSLICSVALEGVAPYKTVISHGFTLDEKGRKMSKSLGNVIDPNKVCAESGADILRLWVSSVYYQSDVQISNDLLKQITESYRKIRNTFRFLLGNISDFNPSKDSIKYEDMDAIDKYMLCRLDEVIKVCIDSYETYEFDDVYRTILNFLTVDLSAFYLDFIKDILYIEEKNNFKRRSIQTVLNTCLISLATIMTPILPHTMDEVYSYLPYEHEESIYLLDIAKPVGYKDSTLLLTDISKFLVLRDDVLKELEIARNERIIGKSLNAKLSIKINKEYLDIINKYNLDIQTIFMVSKLEVLDNVEGTVYPTSTIKVEAATGVTCDRCWKIVDFVNSDCLCERCSNIVKNLK